MVISRRDGPLTQSTMLTHLVSKLVNALNPLRRLAVVIPITEGFRCLSSRASFQILTQTKKLSLRLINPETSLRSQSESHSAKVVFPHPSSTLSTPTPTPLCSIFNFWQCVLHLEICSDSCVLLTICWLQARLMRFTDSPLSPTLLTTVAALLFIASLEKLL